uniref:SAP domain-containing protein n=1 Tax=Meloidogyne javanica TaxID=6303 RepID=A0A915M4W8_MELJA
MYQRPSTGCDVIKKADEARKILRAQPWSKQRHDSLQHFDDIEQVPKRPRILAPVVPEEYRQFTPMEFFNEAKVFYVSTPPDLIRTADMLWFGSVIFCRYALIQSPFIDGTGVNEGKNNWKAAEKLHSFSYGSTYLTKQEFDIKKKKAEQFITTFIKITPEHVERGLDQFLTKSNDFMADEVEEVTIRMGWKNYKYNIISENLFSLTSLMASKEELEKLTVAQIREKLKSRKLPASGPKSELVTRLFDSLMAEEKLLEEGPGGESIDLSGVNMDEVLGLDDEKDTHSSITANEDIEEGKEKQPASCDNSDESIRNNDEEKGANKTDDRKDEEIKGKLITREDQTKRKGTTDEDVKMLKLAERVGLPVKRRVSESESDDILAKREKRFGSFSGNKEGEKILTKKDEEEAKEKRAARKTTDEDSKMLKRAERFGLPLKRGGASSESEQSEILAKREKRFGKVIGSGDTETKKEARVKRFGVVS